MAEENMTPSRDKMPDEISVHPEYGLFSSDLRDGVSEIYIRKDIHAAVVAERDALLEQNDKAKATHTALREHLLRENADLRTVYNERENQIKHYRDESQSRGGKLAIAWKENTDLKALCEQLAGALEDFNILYDQMRASLCIRGAAWHTIGADRQNMSIAQIGAKKALTAYEKHKEKS